jgi:cytochrome c2
MNQIKHILSACLIMIVACIIVNSFFKLSSDNSSNTKQIDFRSSDTALPPPTAFKPCQACHALDKDLTGPQLRGLETRGPWTVGRIYTLG